MAGTIDDEDKARRLARAVASDIRLYHEAELATGADLSQPIAEGRELFESRVVPALHPLFDVVMAEMGVTRVAPPTYRAPAGQPVEAAPRPRPMLEPSPTPRTGTGPDVLIAAAILLLVVAGAMVAFVALGR